MRGTKAALYALIGLIAVVAITGACLGISRDLFTDSDGISLLFTMLALVLITPLAATMHRRQYRAGTILLGGAFAFIWGCFILASANLEGKWAWLTGTKLEESIAVFFFVGLPAAVALMCEGKPWSRSFR